MPIPYCKTHFFFTQKYPKNLIPSVHQQSLHKYIFICLPLLSKEGRKTLTRIYDSSHQKQNKMVFECIFQTPNIIPETAEGKMDDFNLSSVCCFTSEALD